MSDSDPGNNKHVEEVTSSRRSLLTKIWVLLGVIALAELLPVVLY